MTIIEANNTTNRTIKQFACCLGLFILFVGLPVKAQVRSPQHQSYCLKLESQLARSLYGSTHKQDRRKVKSNIRKVEGVFHRLSRDADRKKCYSYFLFSKELRRTPRCLRLHKKIRKAKRELASLNRQLHQASNAKSNANYKQEQIIQQLARNNCGKQYKRAARKNNGVGDWFANSFFGNTRRPIEDRPSQKFQFATHRTLCVRLCDGYYFPISFATTSNRFSTDEGLCQSRCAAPARLFTHANPGGTSDQMQSIDGVAYDSIKHAWRFRKEFVKGCSCKVSEYNPDQLNAKTKAEPESGQDQSLKKENKKEAGVIKKQLALE